MKALRNFYFHYWYTDYWKSFITKWKMLINEHQGNFFSLTYIYIYIYRLKVESQTMNKLIKIKLNTDYICYF